MFRSSMSAPVATDQLRAAEEKRLEIYRAMEPADRLRQALRMNRSMRELMAAGFRQRHPEWTEPQVLRAVAHQILHARTG